MRHGNIETRPVENRLRDLHVQVHLCRTVALTSANWNYDVLSPFWRLYLCDRKGGRLLTGRSAHVLLPGELTLVPAWTSFRTAASAPFTQIFVHFSILGLSPLWLRESFSAPFSVPFTVEMRSLARKWESPSREDGPGLLRTFFEAGALAQLALGSSLEGLGAEALSRLDAWLTSAPALQPAVDLLESDPLHAPGNAELARRCGLGMDHFIRKFKTHTGMTPVQFRLDRKVSRAAQLLSSTSHGLEEIAELAGFSDRYHLGRVFSRRFSIGPAAYRKLHGLETGRDAEGLWGRDSSPKSPRSGGR